MFPDLGKIASCLVSVHCIFEHDPTGVLIDFSNMNCMKWYHTSLHILMLTCLVENYVTTKDQSPSPTTLNNELQI